MRNHLAQVAIEGAENGDNTEAKMLLKVLENPFSEKPLGEILNEFDKNGIIITLLTKITLKLLMSFVLLLSCR